MDSGILGLAKLFMKDPATIIIKKISKTLEGIKQFYIEFDHEEWKFDTLVELYNILVINQAIIYCSTRKRVEDLRDKLISMNFKVSTMHSEMIQEDKNAIMKDFNSGISKLLITTDLFSRNFDNP